MMQEIIVDPLDGAGVDIAFQATVARNSRMICIDSDANIFILRFLLALSEKFPSRRKSSYQDCCRWG
jgi:hypothetical protein